MTQLGEIQLNADGRPVYASPVAQPARKTGKACGHILGKVEQAGIGMSKARHVTGWYRDSGNPRTRYPYYLTVSVDYGRKREIGGHSEEEILERKSDV